MRPPGPVPVTSSSDSPCSRTSRRASGLDKTRPAAPFPARPGGGRLGSRRLGSRRPGSRRLGSRRLGSRRRCRPEAGAPAAGGPTTSVGGVCAASSTGASGSSTVAGAAVPPSSARVASTSATVSPGARDKGHRRADRDRRARARPACAPARRPLGRNVDDGLVGLHRRDRVPGGELGVLGDRPLGQRRLDACSRRPRASAAAGPSQLDLAPISVSRRGDLLALGDRRPLQHLADARRGLAAGDPLDRAVQPVEEAGAGSRRPASRRTRSRPAPCSTISTRLVLRMLAPSVSQSRLARSSQRRSITSASIAGLLDRGQRLGHHRQVGDDRDALARAPDRGLADRQAVVEVVDRARSPVAV